MLTTIAEYIKDLKALRRKHGKNAQIVAFDRLVSDKIADEAENCEFDAVHTAIDKTLAELEAQSSSAEA